jgi:hypothetical protein
LAVELTPEDNENSDRGINFLCGSVAVDMLLISDGCNKS